MCEGWGLKVESNQTTWVVLAGHVRAERDVDDVVHNGVHPHDHHDPRLVDGVFPGGAQREEVHRGEVVLHQRPHLVWGFEFGVEIEFAARLRLSLLSGDKIEFAGSS